MTERLPDARRREDWTAIGHTLAFLHQVQDERFGLEHLDCFFGPLPQGNRPVSSNRWADYYVERRVTPMLRSAVDSGHLPSDLAAGVEQRARGMPVLAGPEPRPSLLHGDAQQNNFVSTPACAVVIDPAPYFGHPEIDLALIDYFHPVPEEVFDAYREITRSTRASRNGASRGGSSATSPWSRSMATSRSDADSSQPRRRRSHLQITVHR